MKKNLPICENYKNFIITIFYKKDFWAYIHKFYSFKMNKNWKLFSYGFIIKTFI